MSILTFPTNIPASVAFGMRSRSQSSVSPLSGSTQTLEMIGAARWRASISYEDENAAAGRVLMAFLADLNGMAGRFYLTPLQHPIPAGIASLVSLPSVRGANCLVNNLGGYPAATTAIQYDSRSRIFLEGEYVKFSGHDSVYELVAGTDDNTLVLQAGGLDLAVADDEVANVYHQGKKLFTDGWTRNTTGLLLPGDYFEINGELKIVTSSVDSADTEDSEATVLFSPPLRNTVADTTDLVLSYPKATMRLMGDDIEQDYYGPIITNTTIECIEAFG